MPVLVHRSIRTEEQWLGGTRALGVLVKITILGVLAGISHNSPGAIYGRSSGAKRGVGRIGRRPLLLLVLGKSLDIVWVGRQDDKRIGKLCSIDNYFIQLKT